MNPLDTIVHTITRAATRPGDDVTSPGDWAHALANIYQHPLGALSHGLTSPYGLPMGIVGPSRVPGHVIEQVDPGGKMLGYSGFPSRMSGAKDYERAINIRRAGSKPGQAGPIAGSLRYMPPYEGDPAAYVTDLYVRPQFRNTSAMMDMLAQFQKEIGPHTPVEGQIVNPKLAKVVQRLISSGKVRGSEIDEWGSLERKGGGSDPLMPRPVFGPQEAWETPRAALPNRLRG